MQKSLFLLTIVFFGIFALASCGKTNEIATNNPTQNTAGKTNIGANKTDEPAKTSLKPGDVSPDNAVKVIELVDSAAAAKDAWKGKEVSVTGYVSGTSSSGKNQLITLTNDQAATATKAITCAFPGDKPDGVFAKNVEVKGKISVVNTDGEYKTINLEPCEIKK